jgi:hypothetical protein
VPVQVQATGVWLRYKDDTSGKYFFYNNWTKDVVWVLPLGATSIEWDDPNVQWNTEARFQIIKPYLVSWFYCSCLQHVVACRGLDASGAERVGVLENTVRRTDLGSAFKVYPH